MQIETVAGPATVYPVVPGSLIVVRGECHVDTSLAQEMQRQLVERCGHDRFVILYCNELAGAVDCRVIGPEELIAWLRAALDHHGGQEKGIER